MKKSRVINITAPSLVVEIISPSNSQKEMLKKFKLFETLGIREYWIIYPEEKIVSVFRLNQSHHYEHHTTLNAKEPEEELKVKVGVLEDLTIDFTRIFEF